MAFRPAVTVAVLMALCASVALAQEAETKEKTAAAAAPGEPVEVDLSTPKKAAMTFAKGLEQGDDKAVRAASQGSDDDYKLVALMGGAVRAAKDMQTAATEKFGAEGAKKIGGGQASITEQLDKSKETIDGDNATISSGEGEPMKLKKTGDDWKIDLAQIPNKEQMSKMTPVMKAIQKAMTDMATEIRADKYKTAEEAQQAMGMKMIGAVGGGAGGPGGPGAQPGPGGEGAGGEGAADEGGSDGAAKEEGAK